MYIQKILYIVVKFRNTFFPKKYVNPRILCKISEKIVETKENGGAATAINCDYCLPNST